MQSPEVKLISGYSQTIPSRTWFLPFSSTWFLPCCLYPQALHGGCLVAPTSLVMASNGCNISSITSLYCTIPRKRKTFFFYLHIYSFFVILTWGYVFLNFREKDRDRKRERNIYQLPPIHPLTVDWTHNLGMCPDQELNPQFLVYRLMFQPTESPGQGKKNLFWYLLQESLV